MVYFLLINKQLLFTVIFFTFLPQIFYNTRVSISRNKLPFKTIIIVAINRLFLPVR